MRCADWGERCIRWAGIRSEVVDVCGTSVHLLRAEAGPEAPVDAPVQLLVHSMASGGMVWLDALGPLTAYGPVIAPDLPGAVLGHTAAPHPSAVRAEPSARFLRALTSTLGIDRVVLHGWSFGGLVAVLFAELEPVRVERLILVDPTLPGPLSTAERVAWHTLGRAGLLVGSAVLNGLIRLFGSALVDAKQRYARRETSPTGGFDIAGRDLSQCSAELITLVTEQLDGLRSQPRRWRAGIVAFASAVEAMYVDRRPVLEAIDRLTTPTLLLWGDQDPLIERAVIDYLIDRRPDWGLRIFETVGHLPPLEIPQVYADTVGEWLIGHAAPGGEASVDQPES